MTDMTREEKMKIVINNYFKTECSVNTSIREALDRAEGEIFNLPSVQQEQRWIPCKERLPELRKWVLCQCRAGIIDVLRLNEEGDWVKLYPNTIYMNGFVTAWQQLPEPYKEEEDG